MLGYQNVRSIIYELYKMIAEPYYNYASIYHLSNSSTQFLKWLIALL